MKPFKVKIPTLGNMAIGWFEAIGLLITAIVLLFLLRYL